MTAYLSPIIDWMHRARHLLLGLMLCAAIPASTLAEDFRLSANPLPPWNTTEPVLLTLTIHNTSNEARRYGIDFVGFDRRIKLVNYLNVTDEAAIGPFEGICADISPSLDALTFCLATLPVPAGERRAFQFDVVAFSDALGFAEGQFEIRTMRSDFSSSGVPIATTEPILFAYGILPHAAVPGLSMTSIMVLVLLLAMIGAMNLHRRQGNPS